MSRVGSRIRYDISEARRTVEEVGKKARRRAVEILRKGTKVEILRKGTKEVDIHGRSYRGLRDEKPKAETDYLVDFERLSELRKKIQEQERGDKE